MEETFFYNIWIYKKPLKKFEHNFVAEKESIALKLWSISTVSIGENGIGLMKLYFDIKLLCFQAYLGLS